MMKHEFEPNIKYINYNNMCICQCVHKHTHIGKGTHIKNHRILQEYWISLSALGR